MGDAWIGVIGALLGAVIGGVLTFIGMWGLKHLDDRAKRRTLATGLLSEIRLLEDSLWDIHNDPTTAYRVIETFQTAMYDQAGANLLLFTPETVGALNLFYNGVHELRTTLARYRVQYPDPRDLVQRHPLGDQEHGYIRIMAASVYEVIPDVAPRLRKDEGGKRPDRPPPVRSRSVGGQLDAPELKRFNFDDQI